MERIVVEPEFARALSRDPAGALRGYALSAAEQRLLATRVSPDPAGRSRVEARISKAGMFALLGEVVISIDADTLDSDGDGLTDVFEQGLRTDPLNPDTDFDTLSDGEEVALNADPLVADSDNDGLSDGFEKAHGTNPNHWDTDGDGRPDRDEVLVIGTDPLSSDADADSDWLPDGKEQILGTDPYNADTDDDGLLDGDEKHLGTDPLNPDTDGDMIPDGVEVDQGSDPLAPTPKAAVLPGVTDDAVPAATAQHAAQPIPLPHPHATGGRLASVHPVVANTFTDPWLSDTADAGADSPTVPTR